jgi:hypothetical protein
MVAGYWPNQDGLNIQYGTQKAIPEIGGDYMVYGDVREIEQYIPLVPMQIGNGNVAVPAPATSFSGTTSSAAAGIQSLTTLFPLAQIAPVTAVSGGQYTFVAPQIFIEQVEVDCLLTATVGTDTAATLSVGLAFLNPGSPSSTFTQITSSIGSAGQQILNVFPLLSGSAATVQATAGAKTIYCGAANGFTFTSGSAPAAVATGGGSWVGTFSPIPTNAITPLPQSAWLSSIINNTGGAIGGGLLKLRIKYVLFGGTNY